MTMKTSLKYLQRLTIDKNCNRQPYAENKVMTDYAQGGEPLRKRNGGLGIMVRFCTWLFLLFIPQLMFY